MNAHEVVALATFASGVKLDLSGHDRGRVVQADSLGSVAKALGSSREVVKNMSNRLRDSERPFVAMTKWLKSRSWMGGVRALLGVRGEWIL